ncbi:MAG: hypothetical protein KC586_30680, partial [Myxococcales bacterium]|nr:hypothetical protein [Myxococcales bacterium]
MTGTRCVTLCASLDHEKTFVVPMRAAMRARPPPIAEPLVRISRKPGLSVAARKRTRLSATARADAGAIKAADADAEASTLRLRDPADATMRASARRPLLAAWANRRR